MALTKEDLLSLYASYCKAINTYTNVIWAFPFVFIAMLGTTYNFFKTQPFILVMVGLFGYILIHAFFKHTYIHEHLKKSLQKIEAELKKELSPNQDGCIPEFKFPPLLNKPFYCHVIVRWSLFLINTLFLLFALSGLLNNYLTRLMGNHSFHHHFHNF